MRRGHDKAGIAPLRAHTYYEPFDYQAGVPPRVVTVPYEEDLAGMVEDIAAAKKIGGRRRAVAALGHTFHPARDRRLPGRPSPGLRSLRAPT